MQRRGLAYELKRSFTGGRTELMLSGVEFLRKLAVLIPASRANLTRYHRVLAPGSKLRARVVPTPTMPPKPTPPREETGTILEVLPRVTPRAHCAFAFACTGARVLNVGAGTRHHRWEEERQPNGQHDAVFSELTSGPPEL
jgi:hypothetical protein